MEQRQAPRSYLGAREKIKRFCIAQTMTEYVLILAAVAVVVFVTYLVMGQSVIKLTNRVNSTLTQVIAEFFTFAERGWRVSTKKRRAFRCSALTQQSEICVLGRSHRSLPLLDFIPENSRKEGDRSLRPRAHGLRGTGRRAVRF